MARVDRLAVLALSLALAAPLAAGERFDPFGPPWGSAPLGAAADARTAYPLGETREVSGAREPAGGAPLESVHAVYEEGRLTRVLMTFRGEGPFQTLSAELSRRMGSPGVERRASPASRALAWRSDTLWADLYHCGGEGPGGVVLTQPPPAGARDAQRHAERADAADRLWLCRLLAARADDQLKSVESLISSLERNFGVLSPVPEDPSCFGAAREAQGEQFKNQHTQLVALRQQLVDASSRLSRLADQLQATLDAPRP